MRPWLAKSILVALQVLAIYAAVMLVCVILTVTGMDPLHRPMAQQMREMALPGLAFAILVRIFKFNRFFRR